MKYKSLISVSVLVSIAIFASLGIQEALGVSSTTCIPLLADALTPAVPSSTTSAGLGGGVANSGQLDFRQASPPDTSYKSCYDQVAGKINGWAWNTNLGYVSFSCQTGLNNGADCGTQNYQTTVSAPDAGGARRIYGWAWGDNIGWISLGCDAGMNNGYTCGTAATNYGVKINSDGSIAGAAWTTSAGWVRFDGAKIDPAKGYAIGDPPGSEIDIEPSCADADGCPPGGGSSIDPDGPGGNPAFTIDRSAGLGLDNMPVANGQDYYELKVPVYQFGELVDKCSAADLVMTVEQNVRLDQTLEGATRDTANVVKESLRYYDAARGCVIHYTSVAPINGDTDTAFITGIKLIVDGTDVPVQNFSPIPLTFNPGINILKIESQALGGGYQEQMFYALHNSSSPARATVIRPLSGGARSFPNNENVNLHWSATIQGSSPYQFFIDPEGNGIFSDDGETQVDTQSFVDQSYDAFGAPSGSGRYITPSLEPQQYVFAYLPPDSQAVSFGSAGASVGLKVSYVADGLNISYKKELATGKVFDQFAQIRGQGTTSSGVSVKSDGDKNYVSPAGGGVSRMAGGTDRNYTKAMKYVRSFAAVQRGRGVYGTRDDANDTVTLNEVNFNATTATPTTTGRPADGLFFYHRSNIGATFPDGSSGNDKPYKVVITNNNPIDAANIKNTTVMCVGCDVYVDQNVLGPIGIVALRDYRVGGTTGKRFGGNIYICSSVTETNLNIIADGSLYAYGTSDTPLDPAGCVKDSGEGAPDALGIPSYANDGAEKDVQWNQYLNYGMMWVNNTIGGYTQKPPVTADGEKASASLTDPTRLKSRKQDLNYFRWGRVMENPAYHPATNNSVPEWCWDFYSYDQGNDEWITESTRLSQSLGFECIDYSYQPTDKYNAPGTTGIANFFQSDSSIVKEVLPLFRDIF